MSVTKLLGYTLTCTIISYSSEPFPTCTLEPPISVSTDLITFISAHGTLVNICNGKVSFRAHLDYRVLTLALKLDLRLQ